MASLVERLIRRPQKYLQRSFWKPVVAEFRFRARAGLIFAAPTIVRRTIRRERPLRAYFFPSPINHFQLAETYLAWKVLWHCNVQMAANDAQHADFAVAWHPSTIYGADEVQLRELESRMPVLNGRCTDIRKSVVDRVFANVFGYSLAIDPRTYHGTILCKSEKNGAHDARLLEGPLQEPDPELVYQRLVSYETPHGYAEWRTAIVGRKPVSVYASYRPLDDRFVVLPPRSELAAIDETFSKHEQQLIGAFCDRMELDFGVLDILRDADDGRIYITDCNNTPTGPSSKSLSIRSQRAVVREVSQAFEREYLAPLRANRQRNDPLLSS